MPGTQGGRRPGQGRPKGSLSKARAVIDSSVIAAGIDLKAALAGEKTNNRTLLPLDVMLFVMNRELDLGLLEKDGSTSQTSHYRAAATVAEKAAPYLHAKLAPKMAEGEDQTIRIKVIGGLPEDSFSAPIAEV